MSFGPDFTTMTVVGTAVNFVLNASFWFAFTRRLKARELLYWAVALFLNFTGASILAILDYLPTVIGGVIGGMLYVSFMGFMLLGFQAFFRRPLNIAYVCAPPILYALTMLPLAGTELGLKVGTLEMFLSIAVGSILICREIVLQNRVERLPSMPLAISVYGSFAVVQVICVVLGALYPLARVNGIIHSDWVGWAMMEIILHKSVCVLVILVMVSDRIEAQLRNLANTDMLTGVRNRRSFVGEAEALLSGAPQTMALAIFDLDHFKRINDTHGHQAGDLTLKVFSDHVASQLSPSMLFGRMGGEEFALFAPVADTGRSLQFLERLRQSVSELNVEFAAQEITIQMSVGVAFSNVTGTNLDAMMAAADHALYCAKKKGRNRVCEFHPAQKLSQFASEHHVEETAGLKIA